MCSLSSLLPYLLTELGLPVPSPCTLSSFMDVASRGLRDPAVLLLDEITPALEAPELDLKFWWSLRSLCTTQTGGRMGVVLTCQQPPAQQAREYEKPSPFFNIFHRMDLGPLSEPAASELVASAGRPFEAAEIEWILDQSGRWPALLQMLCLCYFEALESGLADDGAWREDGLRQIAPYRYLLGAR